VFGLLLCVEAGTNMGRFDVCFFKLTMLRVIVLLERCPGLGFSAAHRPC
jgi:hypothetical protein